ncbi:MAG: hypothetical protein ABEN55_10930 [Bradymonadaceae bacterium]
MVRKSAERVDVCNARINSGTPRDEKDLFSPVELVWIDPTRFDVPVVQDDGSTLYQLTTIAFDFVADVKIDEVFENTSYTPTQGDLVTKSTDDNADAPGKMQIKTPTQLASAVSSLAGTDDEAPLYFDALKVGRVIGSGEKSGFVRVKFDLT